MYGSVFLQMMKSTILKAKQSAYFFVLQMEWMHVLHYVRQKSYSFVWCLYNVFKTLRLSFH